MVGHETEDHLHHLGLRRMFSACYAYVARGIAAQILARYPK